MFPIKGPLSDKKEDLLKWIDSYRALSKKISWVVEEKMQVIPEGYIPPAKLGAMTLNGGAGTLFPFH